MKIQIISYSTNQLCLPESDVYTFSEFGCPSSLDMFDINFIDLSSPNLWHYTGDNVMSINKINDFRNLKVMLNKIRNTSIVIGFPQNVIFSYDYRNIYPESSQHKKYRRTIEIKNCLDPINKILSSLIPSVNEGYQMFYENTITVLDGLQYSASFNFTQSQRANILTTSKSSAKITTKVVSERFFLTTLDILASEEHFLTFLRKCKLMNDRETYPEWLTSYSFLDDDILKATIYRQEEVIKDAEEKIVATKRKLEENLEYKSVLFVNGDPLVNVVFKMLEKIMSVNLSSFIDKKAEDFTLQIDCNLEFVGEIKGINSNVKSENVSQLDRHFCKRLDELEEEGTQRELKALLVINPSRTVPVDQREPVHKTQVDLAIRNKSLIIETKMLLHIYEKCIIGEIEPKKCIEMFRKEIGLLTLETVASYFNL